MFPRVVETGLSVTCRRPVPEQGLHLTRVFNSPPTDGNRPRSAAMCREIVSGVGPALIYLLNGLLLTVTETLATEIGMVYNTSALLDELLGGYDKRLRPDFGGSPLLVDVNLNIRSMGPVSEKDMAYQLDCYFRQSWVDRRLAFSGPLKVLPVSVTILDRLWKPDTHFFNGKKSYLHTVTSPNKLLRINQDGRILYSMRLTVKASCPMHLEKFPMDTQFCPLRLGSHGYGVEDLLYEWTHGPDRSIKMAADMRLSQFDLIAFPAGNETLIQYRGTYSSLYVTFALKRHMGYFLINVYVPCSMLVILSWVAFWINREATADRIALGITTVLTMAFLGIDNRRDLPKVSYSTALDYFVGMCFAFVLATIIQFAGVHFFTKTGYGEMIAESDSEEEPASEEAPEEEVDGSTYQNQTADKATTSSYNPCPNGPEACNKEPHDRHIYYVNKDRRCMAQGRANGQTSVTLHYENQDAPRRKEHCCHKFYNCLKGSASYRDMKVRSRRTDRGLTNSVSQIDTLSRYLFPFVFFAFNMIYWISYLDREDIKPANYWH